MEAPSPITLKPEVEEEITDAKEYTINSNNKNFLLKLGKLNNSKKVIFIIQEINSLKSFVYKEEFSLDELRILSKLFRIFDSIDEAFNEICGILNNKKMAIKEESNEINLYLTLSNLSSKTENICIIIKKKSLSLEKINEIIFNQLNEIKNELNNEKIKNENLKKIVDELVKENNQLKNKVKEILDWKENIVKKKCKHK